MTPKEEICYLTDLLLEATRWQCSEGERLDPLQLEIKDRLARLTGQPSVNVEGVPSDKVESKPSEKYYKAKWAEGRCRVDGKWVKKSDCIKVPRKDGSGWKWALKDSNSACNLVGIPSVMAGTVEATEAPDGLHRVVSRGQ